MKTLTINGREVGFSDEENLLEIIRSSGIELPTFCYHSDLSVYGGCRMCVIEVEGAGVREACSTPPAEGMKIFTHTEKMRKIRRLTLELLLADHDRECTTCAASRKCRLQEIARSLGIEEVRFERDRPRQPVDASGTGLIRDPNKCILCGDCVRMCEEVQGIGVLSFANRGSEAQVVPAFCRDMSEVECVHCGQCASVCPTAAISVKTETDAVWEALEDRDVVTIVQVAPAVRTSLQEMFNLKPHEGSMGRIVAALRRLGFDYVFDTCFTADLTTVEETHELLQRLEGGGSLPLLTSCCPAWVKYCEQHFPEFLDHVSTCQSPQQMFGSVIKGFYARELGIDPDRIFVASIMPCVAKKFEATREEFCRDGVKQVDAVLSTIELARLIEEAGIAFEKLGEEGCDYPLGLSSGAGVIFGASGGVTEAVLRYAAAVRSEPLQQAITFEQVRGLEGLREAEVEIDGVTLRAAIVHGLGRAREVLEGIKSGEMSYDVVEIMACPGGCIGGGGQPSRQSGEVLEQRQKALYDIDLRQQLRVANTNPAVEELYRRWLGEPGSDVAHEYLHTSYTPRKRMSADSTYTVVDASAESCTVEVCVGTGCYIRGSYEVIPRLTQLISESGRDVRLAATFCLEKCDQGVSLKIDGNLITGASPGNIDAIFREYVLGEMGDDPS